MARETFIPNVLDYWLPRLTGSQVKIIILMSRITVEGGVEQGARAWNTSILTKLTGVSAHGILDACRQLRGMGLVEQRPGEDRKTVEEMLRNKHPQGSPSGGPERCAWCGCGTYSLHDHHYPKHRQEGGTEVVRICPNCHSEYHHLIAPCFSLNWSVFLNV